MICLHIYYDTIQANAVHNAMFAKTGWNVLIKNTNFNDMCSNVCVLFFSVDFKL